MEGFVKKIIVALAAGFLCLGSGQAIADDVTYSLDTSVAFNSDYMFRGFNLYNGTSIQPSVAGTADLGDAGALTASVWAHTSAENDTRTKKFTEVDYTLSYSIPVDIVSLSAGHLWYTYPHESDDLDIPDTGEYFVAASLDTLLSPTFSYFRDYDAFDANYYELSFSHLIEPGCPCLGEGFNITPYVAFGFASDAEKVYADDGLVHVTFGVSSDLKLGNIAVKPTLNYTAESDDNAVNQFWFGMTLGYSFS